MTKPSKTLFLSAVLCVLLLVSGRAVAGPIVAGVSFTATGTQGFTDNKSRMMGWQFTVGSDPIVVTELGFQDFGDNGLLASHEVGIWRLSDEFLINSVVVPSGTAATLDAHFRYASLASSSTLLSGETYLISGFDSFESRKCCNYSFTTANVPLNQSLHWGSLIKIIINFLTNTELCVS